MRRLALMLLLALSPAAANAASLAVVLDQAVRLTLPAPAADVIVGNPSIADVAVADQRHLVITGKTYGVTNLLVVGPTGRTIFNRQIVVAAPQQNRVSLFRGPDAITYACAPVCQRTGIEAGVGAGESSGSSSVSAPAPAAGVTASPTTP